MPRVHHRDDAVEEKAFLHFLVGEEGLRDRAGIGEARRLNQHLIELLAALAKLRQDADEIAPHAATNAAVVQLEDFLVRADDQLVVDADLAELVLDYGEAPSVIFGQDAVEQGGLARTEEAGDDGDGDKRGVHVGAKSAEEKITDGAGRVYPCAALRLGGLGVLKLKRGLAIFVHQCLVRLAELL